MTGSFPSWSTAAHLYNKHGHHNPSQGNLHGSQSLGVSLSAHQFFQIKRPPRKESGRVQLEGNKKGKWINRREEGLSWDSKEKDLGERCPPHVISPRTCSLDPSLVTSGHQLHSISHLPTMCQILGQVRSFCPHRGHHCQQGEETWSKTKQK